MLELRWQDGSASRLPHGLLRARCRCAACEQSYRDARQRIPKPRRRSASRPSTPVGDKGLNLVFSDGHGRGIFPWAYLRELGLSATS